MLDSNDPTTDDNHLAIRAREEAEAFSELYRRHFRRVYAYQLLHTGSPDDAQDLTSQTFLAALQGIRRFRGEGSFAAWLMTIAHNQMVSHHRRKRPQFNLDLPESLPANSPHPEEQTLANLRLSQLSAAVRALPAPQAEALALRAFAGLSAAETAAVLGKTVPAVKMLVHRAVQELRLRLNVTLEEIE